MHSNLILETILVHLLSSLHSFIGFLSSLYISLVVIVNYFRIDDDYLNCKSDSDLEK